MTTWVLIVITWFSLASEPGGGWKFWQTFKGYETHESCEKAATEEETDLARANMDFTLSRGKQDHVCMSALEYDFLSGGGFKL